MQHMVCKSCLWHQFVVLVSHGMLSLHGCWSSFGIHAYSLDRCLVCISSFKFADFLDYCSFCLKHCMGSRHLRRHCSFQAWALVIPSSSSIWSCCFCGAEGKGGMLGKRHEMENFDFAFYTLLVIFLWKLFSII